VGLSGSAILIVKDKEEKMAVIGGKHAIAGIFCLLAVTVSCRTAYCFEDIPKPVALAIVKVNTMAQGVHSLDVQQVEQLRGDLGKFFAWQSDGNLASRPKDIIITDIYMPGLRVRVSSDYEGKASGEFISCEEPSLVSTQDGNGYLFYRNQWWLIPSAGAAMPVQEEEQHGDNG